MALALEGIWVVDVSQGVSGPLCSMILGDLGAQVIKVEPIGGDWLREIGPFVEGESSLFIRLNRNKRSIRLDLKREEGRNVLRRLVQGADVFIEGYRPGAMDNLGLSYETLSESNPGLVYCSISGMGESGPMSHLPATELDIQALVGKHRHLGVAGEPPLRIGFDVMSANAAWAAGQGIITALYTRERTGEGQKVYTSLLDAAINLLQWATSAESTPDEWKGRQLSGYTDPPDHGFRCKDASFLLDLGRVEDEWRVFCLAIGADRVADDPRFDSFQKRTNLLPDLKDALDPILSEWGFDDLRELVLGLGGTIVRMNDLESLVNDPQVRALEMVQELQHPVAGPYKTLDIPWDFSESIARLSHVPSPLPGQHSRQVLAEAGCLEEEIARLFSDGVVA